MLQARFFWAHESGLAFVDEAHIISSLRITFSAFADVKVSLVGEDLGSEKELPSRTYRVTYASGTADVVFHRYHVMNGPTHI